MNPRMAVLLLATVLSTSGVAIKQPGRGDPGSQSGLPSSYAILARDPLTGEYGVAAASHAPLIGMNIEFLDADAGGVVVLGGPFLRLNETILIGLRDGLAPDRAIAVGLAVDLDRESRQVLALSPAGVAAFSGEKLAQHHDHATGENFVAAGHQLASDEVVRAMAATFSNAAGPLSGRLLDALAAGREAGGEQDGEHSAALLIVGPGARFATRDRLVDLRIDYVAEDAVSALIDLRAQVDSVYEVLR